MERNLAEADLLVADLDWASWDFYPSQWGPGTLLLNLLDDQRAPVVAVAAPGVSIGGERGYETASWRRAEWESADAFFGRADPVSLERLDFGSLWAEVPYDFVDWAADATAAHSERLRAFFADRPEESEAVELAERLDLELEANRPGALERIQVETEPNWAYFRLAADSEARRPFLLRSIVRFARTTAIDAVGQLLLLALVYGFYRFVRESWAPRGVHVDPVDVLMLPLGQFFLWLYGFAHLLLPVSLLGWLYLRRGTSFVLARNVLLLTAVISIAGYLLDAPQPVYGVRVADSVPAGALATMPGLHLAIAMALAYLGFALCRARWVRIAWLSYPAVVALVLMQSEVRHPIGTAVFALGAFVVALFIARYVLPRLWVARPGFLRRGRRSNGERSLGPGPERWGDPAF